MTRLAEIPTASKPATRASRKCRSCDRTVPPAGPRTCDVCADEQLARRTLEWIVLSGDGVLIRQAVEWLKAIDENREMFRDALCRSVLDEALDAAARVLGSYAPAATRPAAGDLDSDDLDEVLFP